MEGQADELGGEIGQAEGADCWMSGMIADVSMGTFEAKLSAVDEFLHLCPRDLGRMINETDMLTLVLRFVEEIVDVTIDDENGMLGCRISFNAGPVDNAMRLLRWLYRQHVSEGADAAFL